MAFPVTREPRAVIDQAIRSKELSAEFFEFLGRSVPGVKLRQEFIQFARDEKEQRKILLKYRKDLFGAADPSRAEGAGEEWSEEQWGEINARSDLLQAILAAIRSEELATRFYSEAALNFGDPHAKIFFRILAESGRAGARS
jgi:rubrerythrin